MMNCPQCNLDNRETARFCRECGAALAPTPPVADAPSTHNGQTTPAQPSQALEPGEMDTASPPPPQAKPQDQPPPDEPAVEVEQSAVRAEVVQAPAPTAPPPAEKVAPASIEEATPAPAPVADQQPTRPVLPGELAPGALLLERYEIINVVAHEADAALYRIQDKGRCWACRAALPPGTQRGDFCPACGAELTREIEGYLREQLAPIKDEQAFEISGRWYALDFEEPASKEQPFPGGVRLDVGFGTHVGQQYELNEDSLLTLVLTPTFESQTGPTLGLFAVADGIGGHQDGEVASRMVIRLLTETLTWRLLLPELGGDRCLEETIAAVLMAAVQEANTRLFVYSQGQASDMGSTLTAVVVRDDLAVSANVGDSRTYLWRDGQLEQITIDHSAVARLVEAGKIEPEEIYTHPQRGAIYRSLGDKATVKVDTFVRRLHPHDCLILCCDGLWEMLRDEGIEEVLLLEPDPQRAADEMVRRANLAGGHDNISLIIVSLPSKQVGLETQATSPAKINSE